LANQTALLDEALYRCNKCGFCQASCPFYQTTLREWASGRGRLRLLKGVQEGEVTAGDGYLRALFQCFSCSACEATCPSGVPVEDILWEGRRQAASDGLLPPALAQLEETISASGNLTGEASDVRLSWAENLEFEPRRGGQHELIYFVGCVSSLFPQAYGLPQSMVRLLEKEGEDYGVLGADEACCGYPLYVSGLVDEARALAEENLRTIQEAGGRRLITTCPSCYRAWREFYPELLGYDPGVEVVHATEWLVDAGLELGTFGKRVTYQDPCDLGRASGNYDAPRRFLSSIEDLELLEMAQTRAEALCCGGGGNMESLDRDASRAVVSKRMGQAAATGAEVVVTACPQCKRTLASGRSRGARLAVMDIVELAWRLVQSD
jgi:Fe-S oxidoreductase